MQIPHGLDPPIVFTYMVENAKGTLNLFLSKFSFQSMSILWFNIVRAPRLSERYANSPWLIKGKKPFQSSEAKK